MTQEDETRLREYTKNQGVRGKEHTLKYNTIDELEKYYGVDFETIATVFVENFMFGFDYKYLENHAILAKSLAQNVIYQRNTTRYDEYGSYDSLGRAEYIEKTFSRIKSEKSIADAIFVPLEDMTYISSDNTIRVRGMVIQKYITTENANYNIGKEYIRDIEVEFILESLLPVGVYRYHNLTNGNDKTDYSSSTLNALFSSKVLLS